MEKYPILRRLPKRLVLCLYLTCAMFVACALFTFYLENGSPMTSTVHNIFTADELHSETSKPPNGVLRSASTYSEAVVVPPGWSWTSKHISASEDSNNSTTHIQANALLHRTTPHDNTKYNYLNTASSSSSSTSTAVNGVVTKSATPAPTSDTCQTSSMKDSKLILLWTSFFGYWGYLPREKFGECSRCRNCRVTTNRTKLRESDAVVFHARDMSLADLPPFRYPHQRWVFYCLESPPYSDFPGLQHMKGMFNWTMTYRTDSDIITQYGSVTRIHPSRHLDLQSLSWAFSNKLKSVVWLSSHCPTHGGRDAYVEELRKYIDVDVYGTCGTSICPPGATKKCLQEFAKKYKFFLAFENTICKDYITEKFFRTLKYDIIPVVFGGAAYDRFAPPNSFIDALSFKSPKHLAFFLSGVGTDFKLYSKYFLWRKDYSVMMSNEKECTLCSLLHRTDTKPSSYNDLRKWWVDESHCRSWGSKS